jgi:glutamate-1-semialdehyde 2,1-aminomutase
MSAAKGPDVKIRAEELTTRINTHTTRILFMSRSPEWNLKCSRFLLDLLTHLEPKLCDLSATPMHNELKELLESNMGFAEAAVADTKSTTARMALQLNVLYNFIAQADNALNAQLAASAGRDSTSMKILAFISALFLPGSFVAGVFSMSMFDWQYSGDGGAGAGVVSNRFWIYWVIAVPLTMITLLGWGFWWRLEMKRYQKVFKHATGETSVGKEAPKMRAQDREDIMLQRMDSEDYMEEVPNTYRRIWGAVRGAGRRPYHGDNMSTSTTANQ